MDLPAPVAAVAGYHSTGEKALFTSRRFASFLQGKTCGEQPTGDRREMKGAFVMSIRIMTQVWEHSKQKGTFLLVLLALADSANDEGYCWPSIKTLSRKSRMLERNLRVILSKLEGDGELKRLERPGRSNYFFLTPVIQCTPPLQPIAPTPAMDYPPPLQYNAPITVIEPLIESKGEPKARKLAAR